MDIAKPSAGPEIFDETPLSRLQIVTLLLCGLVAVLDGNDTQLMGLGAPAIATMLHVAPSAMGWAISGSWLGAAAGALVFGRLADSFGRKSLLIAAMILFGIFTLATPFAGTLLELTTYRVLTGVGLGGATPCFIALASEYTPARIRGSVVSLVWAAFPLGLLVGGLFDGWLLAHFNWQSVFHVGGGSALVLAVLLVLLLPESLAFLLARDSRQAQADRILARAGITRRPATSRPAETPVGVGLGPLMAEGRLRPTLCIWIMLFACFGTTASMSWVPTILRQHGTDMSTLAIVISFLGLGALIGMAVAGRLVDRFGAARGLVGPLLIGTVSTGLMGYWTESPVAASIFMVLVGGFVGIGASGAIALVALVYPTDIRSTGAGWAMGLGRLGQVAIPGAFAVLMGTGWNIDTIFLILGAAPLTAAVAAILVERKGTAEPALGRKPLHS